jgi:dihydroorotate dehydrogenase
MNLTRKILHRFDPELIHDLTIKACALAGKAPGFTAIIDRLFRFNDPRLETRLGNLTFKNPIGLAAGFDKDGTAVSLLQSLGFGFVEVGTITPKPQEGNKKPRLFRLKEEEAVINRMGFNNRGINALTASLKKTDKSIPVGVNLGKNKSTPIAEAAGDYITGMEKSWDQADYFTINISSPNTEDLRKLQKGDYLTDLLEKILQIRKVLSKEQGKYKQVWLKIAPDLSDKEIDFICQNAVESGIDALVVSNTTISRNLREKSWNNQEGGLSGKPLRELSNEVLDKVNRKLRGRIPTVGVGGIFNGEDVIKKMSLGAQLVQLYTGLIFEGPGIVRKIKKELLESDGSLSKPLS